MAFVMIQTYRTFIDIRKKKKKAMVLWQMATVAQVQLVSNVFKAGLSKGSKLLKIK